MPDTNWLRPGASHRYAGWWAMLHTGQIVLFENADQYSRYIKEHDQSVACHGGPYA